MSGLRNLLDFRRREFVSFLRARSRVTSSSTTGTTSSSTLPSAVIMPSEDHFVPTTTPRTPTPPCPLNLSSATPTLPALRSPNTVATGAVTAVLPSLSPFPSLPSFPLPLSPKPLLPSISTLPVAPAAQARSVRPPALPLRAAGCLDHSVGGSRKRPRTDTLTCGSPSFPSSPSLSTTTANLQAQLQPLRPGRWPALSVTSPSSCLTFPPLKFRRLLDNPTTIITPPTAASSDTDIIAVNSSMHIPLSTLPTLPVSNSPLVSSSPAQHEPHLLQQPALLPQPSSLLACANIDSRESSAIHSNIGEAETLSATAAPLSTVVAVNNSTVIPSCQPTSFNDLEIVNRDSRFDAIRNNNNITNNDINDGDNIDKDNNIQAATDVITKNTSRPGAETRNSDNVGVGGGVMVPAVRNANNNKNKNDDDDNININNNNINNSHTGGGNNNNNNMNQTANFECKICSARFLRKHHMERHVQNVHEGQRPWRCEQCGFSFHQKPNLERHILTVHEEQKPFKCSVCAMSFGRKGVLKKHVQMVHEQTRKFECDICSILFGLKSDLKRHVQSVHQKKRPFVCYVCAASFGRRSDLKRHTLSLHPGAPLPPTRPSPSSSSGQAPNVNPGCFPPPQPVPTSHVVTHPIPTTSTNNSATEAYLNTTSINPTLQIPTSHHHQHQEQEQYQYQYQYYQTPEQVTRQQIPMTRTTGATNTITTGTRSPQLITPTIHYHHQQPEPSTILPAPLQQTYIETEAPHVNIQSENVEEIDEVRPITTVLPPLIVKSEAMKAEHGDMPCGRTGGEPQ